MRWGLCKFKVVVRLVGEGLANNDIAARLFVSPRTVQTRLTDVNTKGGAEGDDDYAADLRDWHAEDEREHL
jgi:DNA-binding NarL/FixJ family response regulator